MNIVKPHAFIHSIHGEEVAGSVFEERALKDYVSKKVLRAIERFGRISHRSEDKQSATSWEPFIKAVVLQHGDWSITEHVSATCEFLVDRGITHELVRHRLFSYTQESTRFVNYTKKLLPSFVMPPFKNELSKDEWIEAMNHAESKYRILLSYGESPQFARSVFPTGLASKLIITGNLRSWRWFFIMRTTKEAHPQMREVTIPLLEQFKEIIPLLYDDIIPEARQADNLRLPK
jgi:thymidylate synthase (FAD)